MMSKDYLFKLLARPRYKDWIYDSAIEVLYSGFVLTDLLDLTLHQDAKTAFHAAWLLDTMIAFDAADFAHQLPLFTKYAKLTTNPSCKRHYARIFMYCTNNNTMTSLFSENDLEPIVEQCFDWLIDPQIKVAVKAFAAETLFNLRYRQIWITEELQNQLTILMINGSPAIKVTGRRLLSALATG